jgi:hypothetical protein
MNSNPFMILFYRKLISSTRMDSQRVDSLTTTGRGNQVCTQSVSQGEVCLVPLLMPLMFPRISPRDGRKKQNKPGLVLAIGDASLNSNKISLLFHTDHNFFGSLMSLFIAE